MNSTLRQSLTALAVAAVGLAGAAAGAAAGTYELTVDRVTIDTGDFRGKGSASTGVHPARRCASGRARR